MSKACSWIGKPHCRRHESLAASRKKSLKARRTIDVMRAFGKQAERCRQAGLTGKLRQDTGGKPRVVGTKA